MTIPKWMSAKLTRNCIFEALREPVSTPSASYCLMCEYLTPPNPTDTVAHTEGNTYIATPGLVKGGVSARGVLFLWVCVAHTAPALASAVTV